MALRLESDPGEPSRADGSPRFVLVLHGFRNDLARSRVFSFLEQRVGKVPAESRLPITVLASVGRETGSELCAALGELGAVTRLSPIEETPVEASPPEYAAPTGARYASADAGGRVLALARGIGSLPRGAIGIPLLIGVGLALFSAIRVLQQPPPDIASERGAREARYRREQIEKLNAAEASARAAHAARLPQRKENPLTARIKMLTAQGDAAAALEATERALQDREDPALLALQGAIYAKMNKIEAARKALERAAALDSDDPEVFVALAGLYRQQGQQKAAIDMLNRAKDHGARGREFDSLVEVMVTEQDAEAKFGSYTSRHFTISFDEGEDQAAADLILAQLEDAYLSVGQKLSYYPSHPIPVVLYAAQDFQRITHSPGWAGALNDGRIKVPVRGLQNDTPELARTLRHEYAHSLILSISGGRCPIWLNEGVAMWCEDEQGNGREEWALGASGLDRRFGLVELEMSFMRLSPLQAAAAYAQSYLAVRHIVSRYGELALQKLLEAFASTQSTQDAFREALSIELSTFEEELRLEQGAG
jgi:tetratricopeptide (TPR) repeat protein